MRLAKWLVTWICIHMCQGKTINPYIGDGQPTFNMESYFHGQIIPYDYWVYDRPLAQETNESLETLMCL